MRKRLSISIAIIVAVVGMTLGAQAAFVAADGRQILEFDTMVGVPQAFTKDQHPIRGINGGGLPWRIARAQGELSAGGDLEIKVRGLVLVAPGTVLDGTNPVDHFAAIVSCLRSDGTVRNVMTGPFPATTGAARAGGGNARIKAELSLPHPCIAPIIFVTSPTPPGAWFASTGG
jgi:hypothetical protein